jgi:hypothetical protein
VLLGDGIRLYDAPGGEPVHLQRADADPTQTVSVRYYPPGRDDQRGRALKLVNRVTSAVFDDDYSFSFA